MISNLKEILKFGIRGARFSQVRKNVLSVNSIDEVKKAYGWKLSGELSREDINDFDFLEDLNQRRIRDAEVLSTAMRNINGKAALEIGTSTGMATALMAYNAPLSKIYTINIPPEEIISGEGGKNTTIALEKEKIGYVFRQKGFTNIEQIYANTLNWIPNIETVDVAFIDGCHDTDFVVNDTIKCLKVMKPGSYILWHDFNPDLVENYNWIGDVCLGVEKLYRMGVLKNRTLHLKDSWIGIYRV